MQDHTELYDAYLDAALRGDRQSPSDFLASHQCEDEELRRCLEVLHQATVSPSAPTAPRASLPRSAGELPFEQLSGYRLLRPLGRGGMGMVFLAEQEALGRLVALKLILPEHGYSEEVVERFDREARAVATLNHPNIVGIHDIGEDQGVRFIAMELVPGRGLDELIRAETRPTTDDLLRWTAEVADGLQAAHDSGLLHRDVKPANIRVRPEGQAVLLDFGLARAVGSEQLTITRSFVGTPAFAPPEQFSGKSRALDARCDIYSLGVTLYLGLTDRLPFESASFAELLPQILTADPPSPRLLAPGTSRDLETVVLKALEKLPERRYTTAAELADDLRAVREGRPVRARPPGNIRLLRKWVARHQLLATSGVLLLLAGAIGFALVYRQMAIAQQEREKAERALDDFDRLADVQHLKQLRAEAAGLWPRRSGNIEAMTRWLSRAQTLVSRRPRHADTVARLRAQTELPASRQVLLEALTGLLAGLDTLEQGSPHGDTIPGVQARLAFSRRLLQHRETDREAWQLAVRAIANHDVSPAYAGLRIQPIDGLVPLGPDPRTGLWEFLHLGTGAPPNRRQGQLRITPETGLVLVLLPGGRFTMGAHPKRGPNIDPDATVAEGPPHEVTVRPFLISKYEMTQGQWLRATGTNPSVYAAGKKYGHFKIEANHPVEQISWARARTVLSRLGLRLPTEAQWEYAARAGSHSVWWTGDQIQSLQGAANLADLTAARYTRWPTDRRLEDHNVIHGRVGQYRPNRFGLHDVIGNVGEWCLDTFARYGKPRQQASGHPGRGGSFISLPRRARSASRDRWGPGTRGNDLGVRPAMTLPGSRR